jgi:hypothetical protein
MSDERKPSAEAVAIAIYAANVPTGALAQAIEAYASGKMAEQRERCAQIVESFDYDHMGAVAAAIRYGLFKESET